MAYGKRDGVSHVFVDLDGRHIDLDINTDYRVVDTTFVASTASRSGMAMQHVSGVFIHKVVRPSTIIEE